MFGPLLEVEMLKKCTQLWREAHFEVKMYKAPQPRNTFWSWDDENLDTVVARSTFRIKMYKAHLARTTFGSWDVEKVHAVVARSTFRSQNVQSTSASEHFLKLRWWKSGHRCGAKHISNQNVQNTPCSDHFWKLRCWKSARSCGAKHISKSRVQKKSGYGALLDVHMSFRVAGARDCAPCQKWAKREGFVAFPKTMAGVGHLKRICKDAFSVGSCSTRDMFIRDVRRSGRWFPERGCILEHQIFRFAEMILRDRCSTSYDLASLFRGRHSTLDRWSRTNAKRIGTRPSALHSTFHFWRKSRRIVSFLMLSTSKIEDILQTCVVFDVVNFKNWGSLAELFRFWRCQVQKLRKSRKIAKFSSLQVDGCMDR